MPLSRALHESDPRNREERVLRAACQDRRLEKENYGENKKKGKIEKKNTLCVSIQKELLDFVCKIDPM
jgi:hypothetical protein